MDRSGQQPLVRTRKAEGQPTADTLQTSPSMKPHSVLGETRIAPAFFARTAAKTEERCRCSEVGVPERSALCVSEDAGDALVDALRRRKSSRSCLSNFREASCISSAVAAIRTRGVSWMRLATRMSESRAGKHILLEVREQIQHLAMVK